MGQQRGARKLIQRETSGAGSMLGSVIPVRSSGSRIVLVHGLRHADRIGATFLRGLRPLDVQHLLLLWGREPRL